MSFIDLNKLNKPELTKSLCFIIIVVYSLWLFKQYSGNHHSVNLHMFKYVSGLFPFKYDIFVQSSNHADVSILYSLFSYLKINPDNDYIGFLLHIIFTTLAGYFLFRFIKDFTPINETNGALIAIFSLLIIDGTLVQATRSSWVYNHTGSTTYFAHSLIFIFIWCLIKKSSNWLLILSSLMLLIAIKQTWFAVGVAIIYSLIFVKPFRKNYWIAGPLIVLIYFSTLGNVIPDYETKLLLFNSVLKRDGAETAFHLQTTRHLISLIISFPIFLLMLMKLNSSDFKNLSFVTLILSLLCFVFGYFYALYGGKFWPEPRLLALSPTRALLLYQLFFWILVVIWIYKSKIYSIFKIALYCSMFYGLASVWKDSYLQGFILFFLIIIFSFITIKIFQYKNFFNMQKLVLDKSKNFSAFMTLIFFLLLIPGVTYLFSKSLEKFDSYALKEINKWTVGPLINDHQRFDNVVDLQKCDDFLFLDLDYPLWSSAISGKSHFYEEGWESYNYLDINLYKIANERKKIFRSIKNNLINKIKVSEKDIKELYNSNIVLILKDKDNSFFQENIKRLDLKNNDMLLLFLKGSDVESFINDCKPNLEI